jgi:hypothetical protein
MVGGLCVSVASWAGPPADSGIPATGKLDSVVLRDGEPIGTDVSDFVREGDRLIVRTRTDIAVEVLFVTVYRFRAEVEEQWHDGRLVALHTRANDDGTRKVVDLGSADAAHPELLRVSYNGKATTVPAGVLPSSFWNPATIGHAAFVDSLTGEIFEATVKPSGTETLEIGGHRIEAHRYALRGGLDRDLWYSPDGQLLKIEFEAEDGSRITVLRKSL